MVGQEQKDVSTGAERFNNLMHELVEELDSKLNSINRTLDFVNRGQFPNSNTFGKYILNLLHITIIDVREATCISVNHVTLKNGDDTTKARMLLNESGIIYNTCIVLFISMGFLYTFKQLLKRIVWKVLIMRLFFISFLLRLFGNYCLEYG